MSTDGKNSDTESLASVNNMLAWVEDDWGMLIAITPPKPGANDSDGDIDVDELLPDVNDEDIITANIDVSNPSLLNIPGLHYENDDIDDMQEAQPADIAENVEGRADRLIEWCQSDLHLVETISKQLESVLRDKTMQNSDKLDYLTDVAASQITEVGKRSNLSLYPALTDAQDLWNEIPVELQENKKIVGQAPESLAQAIKEFDKLNDAYYAVFGTYEKALSLLSQLPAPPAPVKLPDFSPDAVFKTMTASLAQIANDQAKLVEQAEDDAKAAAKLLKEVQDENKNGKQEYKQLVASFQMELNWLWIKGSKWDRLEKQASQIQYNFSRNFANDERNSAAGKKVAHALIIRMTKAQTVYKRIQAALETINEAGYLINNVDLDARLKALPDVAKQIRQQMKALARRANVEVAQFSELLDANTYLGLKEKWNKLVQQHKPHSTWIRGGQQQSQWDILEQQLQALLDEFGRIPKKLRSGDDGKKASKELKKAAEKATDYGKVIVAASNHFLDLETTEIADLPDKADAANNKVFENFLGEFLRPDPARFIKPPTKEPIPDEEIADLLSDIISKLKKLQKDSENLRKSAEVALAGADDTSEATWLQFCEHTGYPDVTWAPENEGGDWGALHRRQVSQVARLADLSEEQKKKHDLSACKTEIRVTERALEKDKTTGINCFTQLETKYQQLVAKRATVSSENEALDIPGLSEINFNANVPDNDDEVEFDIDIVSDNDNPYDDRILDLMEEEELDQDLEDTIKKTIEAIEKGIKDVPETVDRMKNQANSDEAAARQVPDKNAWPAFCNQTGFPHPAWEHPKKAGGPWRELAEVVKDEESVFEDLKLVAPLSRDDMQEAKQLLYRARRNVENGIRYVERTMVNLHKIQFKVRTAEHHQEIEDKQISGLLNEKAGTEGKKMSLVLWGPVKLTSGAYESTLMPIIASKIGPIEVKILKFAIDKLVRPAMRNRKEYPEEYSFITLGVVDDRLVLRVNCTGKMFKYKKKCEDATLVRRYNGLVERYQDLVKLVNLEKNKDKKDKKDKKKKLTVNSLLIGEHRAYSPMFLEFTKDKYAAENLSFYLKTVDMSPDTPIAQKKREDLFENNIKTDSIAEVNVNFAVRKRGEQHALKKEWAEFDKVVFECRAECFKFLNNLLSLWRASIR